MIKTNEIIFNEPIYFVPDYSGPIKIEILKTKDDIAIVKQRDTVKKQFGAYPIALEFVCDSHEDAKRCGRKWESWKRKQNRKK